MRTARGLGWFDKYLAIKDRRHIFVCSRGCLEIMMKYRGNVPQLTTDEIEAIKEASYDAGEYLETLGKTDARTMTPDEWMEFMECICVCYAETIKERLHADEIPF